MKLHNIISLFFIPLFLSCASNRSITKHHCKTSKEIINFFNSTIVPYSEKFGMNVQNKLIYSLSDKRELIQVLDTGLLEYPTIRLEPNAMNFDLKEIFNSSDIDFMKCQFKKNKYEGIGSLVFRGRKIDMHTLKTNKREMGYSIPFFSKNRNFVLIYQESESAGVLRMYKSKGQNWEYIGRILIWID